MKTLHLCFLITLMVTGLARGEGSSWLVGDPTSPPAKPDATHAKERNSTRGDILRSDRSLPYTSDQSTGGVRTKQLDVPVTEGRPDENIISIDSDGCNTTTCYKDGACFTTLVHCFELGEQPLPDPGPDNPRRYFDPPKVTLTPAEDDRVVRYTGPGRGIQSSGIMVADKPGPFRVMDRDYAIIVVFEPCTLKEPIFKADNWTWDWKAASPVRNGKYRIIITGDTVYLLDTMGAFETADLAPVLPEDCSPWVKALRP